MYIIEICINEDFYNAYPRNRTVILSTFLILTFFIVFPLEENYKKSQFSKEERHACIHFRIRIGSLYYKTQKSNCV